MTGSALPLRTFTGGSFRFPARQMSQPAVWCQRLAVFCVPFLIVIVAGHRIGVIETPATFWLLALAAVILVAALILGGMGIYHLWTYGHDGGLKAARGIALSLFLLTPFAWSAWLALSLPQLAEVSTDINDPPSFDAAIDDRIEGMNRLDGFSEAQKKEQLAAYPRISARRYNADAARVFKEVFELVSEREWTVLTKDTAPGQAAIDTEGSDLTARPVVDENGMPTRIAVPVPRPVEQVTPGGSTVVAVDEVRSPIESLQGANPEETNERYLEAVATSRIFAFESDVVIRLVETDGETLVDMRSGSRWGSHDLGSNAERVVAFMRDLDEALLGVAGE